MKTLLITLVLATTAHAAKFVVAPERLPPYGFASDIGNFRTDRPDWDSWFTTDRFGALDEDNISGYWINFGGVGDLGGLPITWGHTYTDLSLDLDPGCLLHATPKRLAIKCGPNADGSLTISNEPFDFEWAIKDGIGTKTLSTHLGTAGQAYHGEVDELLIGTFVPEPSAAALLALGAFGAIFLARR